MKSLENMPEISEISSKLQQFFEELDLKTLALNHKFIKKERSLTAEAFLKMCIASVAESGLTPTLVDHCEELQKLGIQMVPESLNAQFKLEAVNFLKSIFDHLLKSKISSLDKLNVDTKFSSIYIEDSTILNLSASLVKYFKGFGGGASKSAAKLNYRYDLLGDDANITITAATKSDSQLCTIQKKSAVKTGALYLQDLGYYKLDRFAIIIDNGGYIITRFKTDTNVYLTKDKDAEAIDLQKIIKKLKQGQIKDFWVYVGAKNRVRMRMIITKLPDKVAAENRRKYKKTCSKRQKAVKKNRLAFCDCTIYLTNLEEQEYDAEQIAKLYGVRWQIEITFKVWKSIYKMGCVRKMKVERFLCLLYAQLIWITLNRKVFDVIKRFYWNEKGKELSELKCFKLIRRFRQLFLDAFFVNSKELYEDFLNNSIRACQKYGWKVGKKQQPNLLNHIKKKVT